MEYSGYNRNELRESALDRKEKDAAVSARIKELSLRSNYMQAAGYPFIALGTVLSGAGEKIVDLITSSETNPDKYLEAFVNGGENSAVIITGLGMLCVLGAAMEEIKKSRSMQTKAHNDLELKRIRLELKRRNL